MCLNEVKHTVIFLFLITTLISWRSAGCSYDQVTHQIILDRFIEVKEKSASHHFVCSYCVVLTGKHGKKNWHGTKWDPDKKQQSRQATLFPECPYCAQKEAWRPLTWKKCQQTQLNLRSENAERSRPRCPHHALTPAAFHHQRNCKTACTSTIALSFPFPFPVVCPPPPPSDRAPTAKADTVCSRGGKVLTHSTKASLSCCVGTVAPHRAAPGAKSTGIRPFNFTPVLSLNWPGQNQSQTFSVLNKNNYFTDWR